ncbi:MAG: Glucose 1-dehydrogenase [Syntrophorhabdus sp. PtaB.Bin047]|nr:MAG: Glucose 1-dehydrogenase [Syntrophorhabdus sp. PtaB.Bin047]
MDLKGKVAIVTGASRGVGKAMALGLAEKGAAVIIAARTEIETPPMPGSIELTARQIREAGGRAHPVRCDVTDEAEVNNMVSRAIAVFGRVDVLVNNAGIAFPAHAWEMPLKRWELVLKVNLTGAFLCARAVLPGMMERRSGSIINISSIQATQKGSVNTGIAYGVSKAALERFSIGLAEEVRSFNVAVNCLKPRGAVSTEGMAYLHAAADRSRWDTPDMMVRACAFLASQGDGTVTGLVATDEEICDRYPCEGS